MRLVDETVETSVKGVREFVHAILAQRLGQARGAIQEYGQRYAEAMLAALDTHQQGARAPFPRSTVLLRFQGCLEAHNCSTVLLRLKGYFRGTECRWPAMSKFVTHAKAFLTKVQSCDHL